MRLTNFAIGILVLFIIQILIPSSTIVTWIYRSGQAADKITSQNISRNWSGYAATSGKFTGVSGSWTIPKNSKANNFGIDATWVGIGGESTEDLIQAGTQTIIGRNEKPLYEAFFEVLPDPSRPVDLPVKGGDSISVSVIKSQDDKWNINIKDNTTKQEVKMIIPYKSSLSSAEWIEEAPSGENDILPLDNFGTIKFKNATTIKNDQTLTLSKSHATAMHMGDNMGKVVVITSSVGKDGSSFSVRHANESLIYRFLFSPFHLKRLVRYF